MITGTIVRGFRNRTAEGGHTAPLGMTLALVVVTMLLGLAVGGTAPLALASAVSVLWVGVWISGLYEEGLHHER